jgi:3-deoxy-7-phosphoheptulonate synthase
VAAGADGVMVEVHQDPDRALSDGKQSLNKDNFLYLVDSITKIAALENKHIRLTPGGMVNIYTGCFLCI